MRIQIQTELSTRDIELVVLETTLGGTGNELIDIPEMKNQWARIYALDGIASITSSLPLQVGTGKIPCGVTYVLEVGVAVTIAPGVRLTMMRAPSQESRSLVAQTNVVLKGILARPEESAKSKGAYLFCLTGADAGRRLAIGELHTIVGRGHTCDYSLTDLSVSREHARVSISGEDVVIENLSKNNGTLVNNVKIIGTQTLRQGDMVVLGNTVLKFERATNVPLEVPESIAEKKEVKPNPTEPSIQLPPLPHGKTYTNLEYRLLLGAALLGLASMFAASASL